MHVRYEAVRFVIHVPRSVGAVRYALTLLCAINEYAGGYTEVAANGGREFEPIRVITVLCSSGRADAVRAAIAEFAEGSGEQEVLYSEEYVTAVRVCPEG